MTHKQTKQKTGTQTQGGGGGIKEKKQQQYNKGSLLHAVCINLKQQKDRCERKREGRPCCSLLRRDGQECRCDDALDGRDSEVI